MQERRSIPAAALCDLAAMAIEELIARLHEEGEHETQRGVAHLLLARRQPKLLVLPEPPAAEGCEYEVAYCDTQSVRFLVGHLPSFGELARNPDRSAGRSSPFPSLGDELGLG